MDNIKKYFLYLGPKYTGAINAFDISFKLFHGGNILAMEGLTPSSSSSEIVKIPCETYTEFIQEKDKKSKMTSLKNKNIISKKLQLNSEFIEQIELRIDEVKNGNKGNLLYFHSYSYVGLFKGSMFAFTQPICWVWIWQFFLW